LILNPKLKKVLRTFFLFIVIFMKMKEELIKKLVQVQLQWKFLHWQTYGDAKHRTYGELYDGLGDLIDEFISSISIQNFMDGITEFLVSFSDQLDTRYDTDLLNIRDEMLATINKSKYLLTLKY
jgi:hypothetical protein